jgi:hypothetical protein
MERISMTSAERRGSIARGATAGVVAGTVFALAQMAASSVAGYSLVFPAQMAASIWLGHHAFSDSIGTVFFVGAAIHYAIAIAWGIVGGILYEWADWPRRLHLEVVHAVGLGAAFGALVWLVDMPVIAGNFMPWMWRAHQPAQFLLHTVFYGVPLGVTVAALARLMPQHEATLRV